MWCKIGIVLLLGILQVCHGARNRARIHPSKRCEFPSKWTGTWFQKGVHPPIKIEKDVLSFRGKCIASYTTMFYIEDTKEECFRCVAIYEKHPNVLQYRETYCDVYRSLYQACSTINADAPLFSLFRMDADPVPCQLRPPYTFTYSRGHGECKYPLSNIDTCADDTRLVFRFQACADVIGTESSVEELSCLAVWKEGSAQYLVGKISSMKSYKQSFTDEYAYRCFVFDHLTDKGSVQMSQSSDATCDGLVSPWEGSRTMRLTKAKHQTSGCQFPSWAYSHNHWKTLDGQKTYTFHRNGKSFKLSHPHQESAETTFICTEIFANTTNTSTFISYSKSGCKNGFVCLKFHRRHNHIIEIQFGDMSRTAHEACYSSFTDIYQQEFVTLLAPSAGLSGCPHVVNELKVQLAKGSPSTFRPEICQDTAIRLVGCRSHSTIEFVTSCASFTEVKSFHCHGSWEENGRSYLVTGLKNTGNKYCFVYWNKDQTTLWSGIHDTCRRNLETVITENFTFSISSSGYCDSFSSDSSMLNRHPFIAVLTVIAVFFACLPIR